MPMGETYYKMTYLDLFTPFGHAKLGNGFQPIGEENVWNVHMKMYSL
jgi:hypothetical protein